MTPAQAADLRAQHVAQVRAGYDGRNRRPQPVTAADLRARARRRFWNRAMRVWRQAWD